MTLNARKSGADSFLKIKTNVNIFIQLEDIGIDVCAAPIITWHISGGLCEQA